jgi:hypothetical protein
MSAFENVELPMTILGKLKPAEIKKRATELLTSKTQSPDSFLSNSGRITRPNEPSGNTFYLPNSQC